jgi:hypothetical protein
MLNGIWAQFYSASDNPFTSGLQPDPDPEIGSDGFVLYTPASTSSSGNSSTGARFALPAEVTTLGIGVRLWMSSLPVDSTHCPYISFRKNDNTDILTLRVSTTGQIVAVSGADSNGMNGTPLGTSTPVLTANAWQLVEFKVTKGAGTGALQVKVAGLAVADLNLSGLALSSSNIAQFQMGGIDGSGGTGMGVYWKDLVVWDTTGSYINDFQGNIAVYDIVPDGDDSMGWTPSTGVTGFNLVDEGDTGPDDADYISADNTLPAPAVFTMTDLPPDVIAVRAVMPIGRFVKTDGGDCQVLMRVSPNGVDWDPGDDRPITVANTYWWDKSYVSPDTSGAWTPSEVDDMLFEIDRTV